MKRLNTIKLYSVTLGNICKALVCSIIEYSSLMIDKVAKINFQKLNVIQNNEFRVAFKRSRLSHQND